MSRSLTLKTLAGVGSLVLLIAVYLSAAAVAPGNAAFQSRWERTDDPVKSGQVSRTWIWGPEANTNVIQEAYAESPGGMRQVQYYDKSRMEINDPSGNPDRSLLRHQRSARRRIDDRPDASRRQQLRAARSSQRQRGW